VILATGVWLLASRTASSFAARTWPGILALIFTASTLCAVTWSEAGLGEVHQLFQLYGWVVLNTWLRGPAQALALLAAAAAFRRVALHVNCFGAARVLGACSRLPLIAVACDIALNIRSQAAGPRPTSAYVIDNWLRTLDSFTVLGSALAIFAAAL